jgi:hypothetical protein
LFIWAYFWPPILPDSNTTEEQHKDAKSETLTIQSHLYVVPKSMPIQAPFIFSPSFEAPPLQPNTLLSFKECILSCKNRFGLSQFEQATKQKFETAMAT